MIIFPDLGAIQEAFPAIDPAIVRDDLAYPAMMTLLPAGVIGLIVASLIAAFMSTISSHLNWGSSYVVHDFYHRFIAPNASEKELVRVGRISTVLLMLFSALFALVLSNALQAFQILLQIGAGTGLLFILRWFWYRINAYSELTAMIVSFVLAIYFQVIHASLGFSPIPNDVQFLWSVSLTTLAWVGVTLYTSPTDMKTLKGFYTTIRPHATGWKPVVEQLTPEEQNGGKNAGNLPLGILCMLVGAFAIYGALFSTGLFIYGETIEAWGLTVFSLVAFYVLFRLSRKLLDD